MDTSNYPRPAPSPREVALAKQICFCCGDPVPVKGMLFCDDICADMYSQVAAMRETQRLERFYAMVSEMRADRIRARREKKINANGLRIR